MLSWKKYGICIKLRDLHVNQLLIILFGVGGSNFS